MVDYIDLVDTPEDADECRDALKTVFPDMCPKFLEKTAQLNEFDPHRAVDYVLSLPQYDKRPQGSKRKRSSSPPPQALDLVSAARAKYDSAARQVEYKPHNYRSFAKKLLSQEFPRARADDVRIVMAEHNYGLYPSYLAWEDVSKEWQRGAIGRFPKKKTATVPDLKYTPDAIDRAIRRESDPIKKGLLEELKAVRAACAAVSSQHAAEMKARHDEEQNLALARAHGGVAECGCCFGDFAINRLVHCDGESTHLFCIDCARRNAEVVVGMTQYELRCMSTDVCPGGFSVTQRRLFLDDKLTAALDRIEYEAVLRLSGIENLERCPFCPFAAEYPPVEQDKEFRCGSDDCGVVSCRVCKEETHVPKSCEEASKDKGMSARRQIEEAMSAAMIRKCNKCSTPFIKDFGCNKMTCTSQGCHNIQCYVCSKSCGYDHFDDVTRGGKVGNCPLFDDQEKRHEEEVTNAEKATRERLVQENPEVSEEHLRFNMSERVAQDDERRRLHESHMRLHQHPLGGQGDAAVQAALAANLRRRNQRPVPLAALPVPAAHPFWLPGPPRGYRPGANPQAPVLPDPRAPPPVAPQAAPQAAPQGAPQAVLPGALQPVLMMGPGQPIKLVEMIAAGLPHHLYDNPWAGYLPPHVPPAPPPNPVDYRAHRDHINARLGGQPLQRDFGPLGLMLPAGQAAEAALFDFDPLMHPNQQGAGHRDRNQKGNGDRGRAPDRRR